MSDPCKNPDATNPQLISACGCQKAANALADAFNVYEQTVESNNQLDAAYNNQMSVYNTQLSQWQQKYNEQKANYESPRQNGGCAPAWTCSNSTCPSGWQNDGSVGGNQGNCSICSPSAGKIPGICANTGCAVKCRPSDNTVTQQMNTWQAQNPPPTQPAKPATTDPNPPTGNNIQCCSQMFSNIDATSATFSNIQQNCTQTITNTINQALAQNATIQKTTDQYVSEGLALMAQINNFIQEINVYASQTASYTRPFASYSSYTTAVSAAVTQADAALTQANQSFTQLQKDVQATDSATKLGDIQKYSGSSQNDYQTIQTAAKTAQAAVTAAQTAAASAKQQQTYVIIALVILMVISMSSIAVAFL